MGALVPGLVVPAYLSFIGMRGPISMGTTALIRVASALGDFIMKFSSAHAGVHLPVWTQLKLRAAGR